jgi:hypothetical protein
MRSCSVLLHAGCCTQPLAEPISHTFLQVMPPAVQLPRNGWAVYRPRSNTSPNTRHHLRLYSESKHAALYVASETVCPACNDAASSYCQ